MARSSSGFQDPIKQTRYSIFGSVNSRSTAEDKDQRFVNCFPEVVTNSETGAKKYTLIKRAGYSTYITPKVAGGVGRAIYSWNGKIYTVIDNGIYSNTTLLGTMGTSTGYVSIVEMSQNAGVPYLCFSDGQKLYLVTTGDVLSFIDNTQVQKAAITNQGSGAGATGTWGTTGGGGTGATGTFTVSGGIITATTVTTRGSGYTSTPTISILTGSLTTGGVLTANLCAFPPSNITSIIYMDGYLFVGMPSGRIYNSDLGDATSWTPSSYISAEMFSDNLVALARQNNLIVALGTSSTQFFYDAANAVGSPLANQENAILQFGTVGAGAVVQHENFVSWVAKGETGGYFVVRLDGVTSTKRVSIEGIERNLNADGLNLPTMRTYPIRYQGHFWLVLKLSTRTFLYDYDDDTWHEWEDIDGSNFPAVDYIEFNARPMFLHQSSGIVFQQDVNLYQDNGVNFTTTATTSKVDMDLARRKFMWKFELGCDKQTVSAPITIEYSDDDYQTWSSPRTLDMSIQHPFLKRLGSFRRRAFRLKTTNNAPMRLDYMELETEAGEY